VENLRKCKGILEMFDNRSVAAWATAFQNRRPALPESGTNFQSVQKCGNAAESLRKTSPAGFDKLPASNQNLNKCLSNLNCILADGTCQQDSG
jgi:hypothetical protein